MLNIPIEKLQDLTPDERRDLYDLKTIYERYEHKNAEKERYYEGHIRLSEVNLGIALPEGLQKLEIGCEWGAKAVDVLAARSMFDGFVSEEGAENDEINDLMRANRLIAEYSKAVKDELKFGSTFATLSADDAIGCKIRFHSPRTAAALWSGEKGRIKCGFAIIDIRETGYVHKEIEPRIINYYTENDVIVFTNTGSHWTTERHPHAMGRPLMEPLIWSPTTQKPLGRSRIKESVRRLIQGYVRTIANATIGLEFATSPQKYLLGVTDEQFDTIINQKFKQYVGSILASTTNPETGEKPSFGQLPQGTISPHVEMMRVLATQFSAATGLSVTDTGVVNDSNPTSSDAILAQTQTLVSMAEQLNQSNGDALGIIIQMALAVKKNVTLDELTDDEKKVIPHFKNPAMPSISATADAAIKVASSRPEFAKTDVFLEMIGFNQADIRRIRNQETASRGFRLAMEIDNEA